MRTYHRIIGASLLALAVSYAPAAQAFQFPHNSIYLATDTKGSSSPPSISRPSAPSISRPQATERPTERPAVTRSDPGSSSISRPQAELPRSTGSISRPQNNDTSPATTTGSITRPGAATPATTSSITRPGTVTGSAQPTVAQRAPPSAVDQAIARGQSKTALTAFRADQEKFKNPPIGVPESQQAARASPVYQRYGSGWRSADDYYASRNAALQRMPPDRAIYWREPPIYVREARPAYGPYSGLFLGSLLGAGAIMAIDSAHASTQAQWAYSHYNDPGYRQWHDDMIAQAAARNDDELRQRIAALDNQVADLKAKNAPTSEALPEGVDPSLVVAPHTVVMATTPEGSSHSWITILVITMLVVIVVLVLILLSRRRRYA